MHRGPIKLYLCLLSYCPAENTPPSTAEVMNNSPESLPVETSTLSSSVPPVGQERVTLDERLIGKNVEEEKKTEIAVGGQVREKTNKEIPLFLMKATAIHYETTDRYVCI